MLIFIIANTFRHTKTPNICYNKDKMKRFNYTEYNKKYNYDQYKRLYEVMTDIFKALYTEKLYEDETQFEQDGMIVFIDKEFGSLCELKNTSHLPLLERVRLHEEKLKEIKGRFVQLSLFVA